VALIKIKTLLIVATFMYILPHLFHINSLCKHCDCRAFRENQPMGRKGAWKTKR